MAILQHIASPVVDKPIVPEPPKEEYKAPEFIFPKKDPEKQSSLDALIHAISALDVPDREEKEEASSLDDKQLKRFAKILKLLNL